MHLKTRGIIFGSTRYGETSVIARIYTEELGLQSFMIRGVRKKRSAHSAALLQQLSLVELEARVKERADIHTLAELRIAYPYTSIPFDIVKSTQLLFLNEVLSKSIREQEKNAELFSFLFHSLQLFDTRPESLPDFHLLFCIRLSRFLGFYPSGEINNSNIQVFDLVAGSFCVSRPLHGNYIEGDEARFFSQLLSSRFEDIENFSPGLVLRRQLSKAIIDYYSLHVDSFGNFKSLEILESVFS